MADRLKQIQTEESHPFLALTSRIPPLDRDEWYRSILGRLQSECCVCDSVYIAFDRLFTQHPTGLHLFLSVSVSLSLLFSFFSRFLSFIPYISLIQNSIYSPFPYLLNLYLFFVSPSVSIYISLLFTHFLSHTYFITYTCTWFPSLFTLSICLLSFSLPLSSCLSC